MNQTFCILGRTTLFVCSYAFLLSPCSPTCLSFFVYELDILYHVSVWTVCACCVKHNTEQRSFPHCLRWVTNHPSFVLMVVTISPEPFGVCIALYSILHLLYLYSILSVYCMHINMYIHSCMYVCIVCLYISVYVCVFVHSLSLEMCGYSYTLCVCQL